MRHAAVRALAASLLAACVPVDETVAVGEEVGTVQSDVVSGWTATWAPSVGVLVDATGQPRCSGTLVAPRAVLTAAHCASDAAKQILFGQSPNDPRAIVVPVRGFVVHPGFDRETLRSDIAIAVLSRPAPSDVWPAAIAADALGPDFVGRNVALLGYGLDGIGGTFARRGGLARVVRLDDTTFRTELGPSQPCGGDSGGPALVESDRETIVLGVVSSGDARCESHATYTRIDVYLSSFVDPTLAAIRAGRSEALLGASDGGAPSGPSSGSERAGAGAASDGRGEKGCSVHGTGGGTSGDAIPLLLLGAWICSRGRRRAHLK